MNKASTSMYENNSLNCSPSDKIFYSTKFKAFADGNMNVVLMMTFLFDRVENIVGKGENIGY